jgi:hypothetical protein
MARHRSRKSKSSSPARTKVGALILILLITFGALGTISLAVQEGWTIPGLGSIGLGSGGIFTTGIFQTKSGAGSTNSSSSGGTQACSGSNCITIPSGTVAFNLQLVAEYSDGTNATISSQSGLPALAGIQINGKQVNEVDAQAVVGYVSNGPLPAGSTANFVINFTQYNEQTHLNRWNWYTITTGFVDNNTLAVFRVPDFTAPAVEVYSDYCANNSTGYSCTFPSTTPAPRRVDWNLNANVTLSIPGLQLITSSLHTGNTVGAADFSASGITGCTNCGTTSSSPIAATLSSGAAQSGGAAYAASLNHTPPPSSCTTNCGYQSTNPTAPNYACANCIVSSTITPAYVAATVGAITGFTVTSTTTYGGTSAHGAGSGGSGGSVGNVGSRSFNSHLSANSAKRASLLPESYINTTLFGGLSLLNPWAVLIIIAGWVLAAIALVYLIIRLR